MAYKIEKMVTEKRILWAVVEFESNFIHKVFKNIYDASDYVLEMGEK